MPLDEYYALLAARQIAKTVRTIAGTRPITVRQRWIRTQRTRAFFPENGSGNAANRFILGVSKLGSGDVLG